MIYQDLTIHKVGGTQTHYDRETFAIDMLGKEELSKPQVQILYLHLLQMSTHFPLLTRLQLIVYLMRRHLDLFLLRNIGFYQCILEVLKRLKSVTITIESLCRYNKRFIRTLKAILGFQLHPELLHPVRHLLKVRP